METLSEIRRTHPRWNIKAIPEMDEVVNCARCGRAIIYGTQSYTAYEELTDNETFGLPVCASCYAQELKSIMEGKANGEKR